MLFVKFHCTIVSFLHMKCHLLDGAALCAILDSLFQKLRGNAESTIRLQHSDCHDVDSLGSIFLSVFFARDRSHQYIFQVCKLGVASVCSQSAIEVFRINNWQVDIVENSELFEVFLIKISEFDFHSFELSLWPCNEFVIEDSLFWFGKFKGHWDFESWGCFYH